MQWEKKGLIIRPGKYTWWMTHAQNPFPVKISGDVYRVYFAGRDRHNRARGGWADIDLKKDGKVIRQSKKPILDLGPLGCFDDCGAMPSCIVPHGKEQYMYFTGWTQARATPFSFFIGLAVSKDGGKSFKRYSLAPVLGRNRHDPFLSCSPWVIKEGRTWKMWYVSGQGWEMENNTPYHKHYYNIKYATSSDGIDWKTSDHVCIGFNKGEYAIARPVVYREGGRYKMWYCYRGGYNTYRAGYAESKDGVTWKRKDSEAGIDVSPSGWDETMICYPCVFTHRGKHYMLYNGGRNFGDNGCGLAVRTD